MNLQLSEPVQATERGRGRTHEAAAAPFPCLHGIAFNSDTGVAVLWGSNTRALMAEFNYGHLMIGLKDKRYTHWTYAPKYRFTIPKDKCISTSLEIEPREIRWHEGELTMYKAVNLTKV